jgi:UDP-N-acetylglucosamine 2-epimerase (non-hydrolysing)
MPEELNRLVTDQLSDILLTPSADADANLLREGIPEGRIFRVGNIMIDSLLASLERARASDIAARLGVAGGPYGVVTLHRPSNVDDSVVLGGVLGALVAVSERLPLVFPMHPRARRQIEAHGLGALLRGAPAIRVVEPLGYVDFLALFSAARLVLTDSGGLQEETTALGIPCLTLREHTERPVTVTEGTNEVVGTDPERIVASAWRALDDPSRAGRVPALWDGRTAERIADVLSRVVPRAGR